MAIEVHLDYGILAGSKTIRISQFLSKGACSEPLHLQSNMGGKEKKTAEWARKAFVNEAGNGRPRMNSGA